MCVKSVGERLKSRGDGHLTRLQKTLGPSRPCISWFAAFYHAAVWNNHRVFTRITGLPGCRRICNTPVDSSVHRMVYQYELVAQGTTPIIRRVPDALVALFSACNHMP